MVLPPFLILVGARNLFIQIPDSDSILPTFALQNFE